ncbi:MAG TPA: murein biosynthesis integral membrane protein MurJ [Acidimicrobiales bacterium]|nr:murein biosynthesis integral membrane protein MurJ [Acidimicrobiales bacterium]
MTPRGRRRRAEPDQPPAPGPPDDHGDGEAGTAGRPGPRRAGRGRPYETELHYGEANRRRAREFLGLSESAVADRPGRRWARDDGGQGGPYGDDDPTGELPSPADMLGVAPGSPGVTGQPLAPWMTGEHRALRPDGGRAVRPPGEPPPPGGDADPPPGRSVFDAPGAGPPPDRPPPHPEAPAAAPPARAAAHADISAPGAGPPPITGSLSPVTGPEPLAPPAPDEASTSSRGSFLVAAGILLSRCAGLIREMAIGAFLGTTAAADAFKAALRIPNLMQNLLGEGVLSASFIPVYSRLRAEGRHDEAGHVAGAVAGLLAALTGALSLVGVLFADPLTSVLAPGFEGAKHELTVQLTRIMFPGIGFLVLSAWCLGVLNSHRQFFLSYVAPVLWNVAQITLVAAGVLVVGGHDTPTQQHDLAVYLGVGVLVGGVLQFAVQILPVRRLLGGVRLSLDHSSRGVRNVISRFVPVLLGRGAIQIMGWVDLLLASYLASGAIAALTYTMVLYLLPVGLFGVSVAAAELPDLSQVEVHDPDTRRRFRLRLEDSMARIAWYVAFTATAFIVVGDVVVAAVFERGVFDRGDTVLVWLALAVLSMGLLPVTATRLLQNGLYALDDARTPARLGVLGVVLAAVLGVAFMFPLDRLVVGADGITGWGGGWGLGPLPRAARIDPGDVPHLGIVGLSLGAMVSDWIEYRLLSSALAWRVGRTKLAGRWLGPIGAGCAAAAGVAYGAQAVAEPLPAVPEAVAVLVPAGLAYLGVTRRLGVPEAIATLDRLSHLLRRARR